MYICVLLILPVYIGMHPYAFICIRHASVCTNMLPYVSFTDQMQMFNPRFRERQTSTNGKTHKNHLRTAA